MLRSTEQQKKYTLVTQVVEDITATDGIIKFPSRRCVISACAAISNSYCPVPIFPVDATQDRAYVYVDRNTTGFPTKAFTAGTTYRMIYKYIPYSI